jgi:hypothetical protein
MVRLVIGDGGGQLPGGTEWWGDYGFSSPAAFFDSVSHFYAHHLGLVS